MKESNSYSRRDVLGLLSATALAAAAIYLPKDPKVHAQGTTIPRPTSTPTAAPTPTPEVTPTPEESASYWIGDINRYAYYERYPFALVDTGQSKKTVTDICNTWGGITQIPNKYFELDFYDVPLVFEAMNKLNLPLTTLVCDPNTVDPFLPFYDDNNTFSFTPVKNGYKADAQPMVGVAIEPEQEAEPDPYTPQIIIEAIVQTASTREEIPYHTEQFDEAIKETVFAFGEGTNQFSQELYPYIRKFYDKNLLNIHSADGLFPYNTDAELFTQDFLYAVMNLEQMGGYSTHSVLIQSALKVLFPDGYNGSQMNPADLSKFINTLATNTTNKPSVIVYPYSLNDSYIFDRVSETMSGKDVDHNKTILASSTFNKNLVSKFSQPIPKGVVCFTSVRKDANGKLFMPPNRSYIYGDDRMFGFPDITNAVQAKLGAKKEPDGSTKLIIPYAPIVTAGASLSTMQGGAFIASVTSKLLKDGYLYSEELVMNTMWELCPETKVDDALLRVPNMQRVQQFFGSRYNLPWILS